MRRFGIVVDAGFSYTHVVPFVQGQPHVSLIRRIDVGGKLMTNYLKVCVVLLCSPLPAKAPSPTRNITVVPSGNYIVSPLEHDGRVAIPHAPVV
jgi:hypothetical protein